MRRVPSRDTTPEQHVRAALRAIGRPGYRLHRADLAGRPDIAYPGRRLAIWVHGCFWHGHTCRRGARVPKTNAAYWSAKIARNRTRDAAAAARLEAEGWRALVVWECETRDRAVLAERLRLWFGAAAAAAARGEDAMSDDAQPALDALEALDALDPAARDLGPRRNPAALEFLLTRRSTPAKTLQAPGPSDRELARMLRAAARVPDHKKLTPWRFLVLGPATRQRLADAVAVKGAATGRAPEDIEKTVRGLDDGPVMVAVVASPKDEPSVPEFEQLLSTGAVAAGLVNAALASGYGANWLSGWPSHDLDLMRETLGLGGRERIAAFVHIGTPSASPPERPRPDLASIVTHLA